MVQSITKNESPLHVNLVEDLVEWLRDARGYSINAADLEGYFQPRLVENENEIGDGEDKRPDVDAFDDYEKVYVRGEAKTGDGDLETPHTETQLRLFANRHNSDNGKKSLLFIIVPSAKIDALKEMLRDVGLVGKPNVIPVKSGKF